jgi:hypothetical protein
LARNEPRRVLKGLVKSFFVGLNVKEGAAGRQEDCDQNDQGQVAPLHFTADFVQVLRRFFVRHILHYIDNRNFRKPFVSKKSAAQNFLFLKLSKNCNRFRIALLSGHKQKTRWTKWKWLTSLNVACSCALAFRGRSM